MFFGHLKDRYAREWLSPCDPIRQAFAWIETMPPGLEPGVVELCGRELFVNIDAYETLPRERCRFESHRKYVDLQVCIEGGEWIDHAHLPTLEPATAYAEETDLWFHHPVADYSVLRMAAGDFAIFWPEDAHRPKVHDGKHDRVRKLVFKIAIDLMQARVANNQ